MAVVPDTPPEPAAAPRAWDAALHFWRLSRPEVWMVSILPAYVGWVLATHELVPSLDLWTAFWAQASHGGANADQFGITLWLTIQESWRIAAALLVMGPLVWIATLLINDVHDLPGDRVNPRKAGSPLVRGEVSVRAAHVGAYVAAAAAMLVAVAVGRTFAVLTLGCLALAWAYSVPPLRLKTRPGADVAVNAIGVGVLAGLAGWSVARPIGEFPFRFLPQGLLVATAIYVPTTLVDAVSDRRAGYLTLATHLGERRAYRIGWWAWVLANAGALALSWNDLIIPRRMLPVLLIFVPLLLWEYHLFIGRARSPAEMVRGVVLCGLTFLAVDLVFALMYTGMWV